MGGWMNDLHIEFQVAHLPLKFIPSNFKSFSISTQHKDITADSNSRQNARYVFLSLTFFILSS